MKYKDSTTGNFEELTVTAFDSIPIGSIIPFSGTSIPTGYMLCDGTAISRTVFAKLFSIIGTMYGTGDGSTTFNIPNLKGKVPVGQDTNDTDFDNLGETGGSKYLQAHTHTSTKYWGQAGSVYGYKDAITYFDNKSSDTTTVEVGNVKSNVTTGNSGNLQPYLTINYIIKVEQAQILDENIAQLTGEYVQDSNKAYTTNYINDKVETKEVEITYDNNFTPYDNITKSRAVGNVVSIGVRGYFTSVSNNSYLTIGTIEENYRPNEETFAVGVVQGMGSILLARIRTNGIIDVYNRDSLPFLITSSQDLRFNFTYIID